MNRKQLLLAMQTMTRELSAGTKLKTLVGQVLKTRAGNSVIVESKTGRKFREYKWALLSDPSRTGWLKVPLAWSLDQVLKEFPLVRKATASEMRAAEKGLSSYREEIGKRHSEALDGIRAKDLKAGDVVAIKYSNLPHAKNEVILEVDYRAAKIAIVRQDARAASELTKRRLIPIAQVVKKVADGGGKFDPNNPLYKKHGVWIPEFYKQGGKVAKRKPKPRYPW